MRTNRKEEMLLVNTKLSVEQRLQKAVSDIMMNPKYIALAGLMTLGERLMLRICCVTISSKSKTSLLPSRSLSELFPNVSGRVLK